MLIGLTLLIALAGCGSGTGTGGAAAKDVNLDAQDSRFAPNVVSTRLGERLSVTVHNRDGYEHNFSIAELNLSQDLEKGETKTITFTTPGRGNLQFFCKYHRARGMTGTLDLGGGAAPSGQPGSPASSSAPGYGPN